MFKKRFYRGGSLSASHYWWVVKKSCDAPAWACSPVLKALVLDLRDIWVWHGIQPLPNRPFLILANVPGPRGRTPLFFSAPAKRDFILGKYIGACQIAHVTFLAGAKIESKMSHEYFDHPDPKYCQYFGDSQKREDLKE